VRAIGAVARSHSGLDLDSHADMAVLGENCRIISDEAYTIQVYGYDKSLGSTEREVVSGVFAYDDPDDGLVTLLVVHQGIHVPTMEYSMVPPFQLRCNDVKVDECPKSLTDYPTETNHTIRIHYGDGKIMTLPLLLRGGISYLPVRRPTEGEMFDETIPRHELTYETPRWDPDTKDYEQLEEALSRQQGLSKVTEDRESRLARRKQPWIGTITTRTSGRDGQRVFSQSDAVLAGVSITLMDDTFGEQLMKNCIIASMTTERRGVKTFISPELLARNWCITLDQARKTIEMTTQRMLRARPTELSRRFRTNDRALRYRRLDCSMFTDTMFSNVLSKRMNKCAQVYAIPPAWVRVEAMKTKADAHFTLSNLFRSVGAPEKMVMDNAPEQVQGQFAKKCRDASVTVRPVEAYSPWSNYAESMIRELKKGTRRTMVNIGVPKRLWDDCLEHRAKVKSHTYHEHHELQDMVPQSKVIGQTVDISHLAEFAFYDWVFWLDSRPMFPEPEKTLGRYLGPSDHVGSQMTAKILRKNGVTRHVSTFKGLTAEDLADPRWKREMEEFDVSVARTLGDKIAPGDLPGDETPEFEAYEDDEEGTQKIVVEDRDEFDADAYDPYLNAEVLLPIGGEQLTGTIVGRKRDAAGNPIGRANVHPILDTREYLVKFPDGQEAAYTANLIAQNMIAQCDSEGNQFRLMKGIVDHMKGPDAVEVQDGFMIVRNRRVPRKTTKGWKLCVEWVDGTTSWEPLNLLKESNPVEVAEYAVAAGIAGEPAFGWWVPYTMKKRSAIISAVNKRYWKKTHKFGIRLPHSVQEATAIDRENGDTKWADAINKEMTNVDVAFDYLKEGEKAPPGYQMIDCHMIFDIKLDNTFTRKARMVAGGHMTKPPSTLTYASVVSRDSVRIALTMAALHDLQVKTADIQNAYLTAPCREKVATVCGPEFGTRTGRVAIIKRALYGLKSSGSAFRQHLADCMRHLGYLPCKADNDVWMKPMKRDDGFEYYAYILLYVDDVLCVHHDGMLALREIDHYFKMKEVSMGDPDLYLGAKVRQVVMPNGVCSWMLSPAKYIKEAVKNVEKHLQDKYGKQLPRKAPAPFPREYEPELDVTKELEGEEASYYQSQIGTLRWMVEIGRIDIITEVSKLASQLALPREGHMNAIYHLYAYLKDHRDFVIALDPTYPEIDYRAFNDGADWKSFYGDVKEPLPPNAPEEKGCELVVRLFVDSDHAGDKLIRRSRTGYLVYCNNAPILWFSKRQGTVESSVFGAEFVALRVGMEAARGLRYKLRMMGIPIREPTFVYGDNMSVIYNASRPESTLKKKSNEICYHFVRESVAMGESLVTHVRSEDNPADICTKIIPGGQKRDKLTGMIMYNTSNENVLATTDGNDGGKKL
jgi:hypothetical protein